MGGRKALDDERTATTAAHPGSPSTAPVAEGDLGVGTATVLHRWQEEQRLSRFFVKLFGEVLYLEAERVEFKLTADNLVGAVLKQGKVVKSLTVKPLWLEPMCAWLLRHPNPFTEGQTAVQANAAQYPVSVAVRCGDELVCCIVERTTNLSRSVTVVLRQFSRIGWSQVVETFGVMPYGRRAFDAVFSATSGLILAVVRPGLDYTRTLAPFTIASQGAFLGDLSDAAVRALLPSVAAHGTVVVSVAAEDPIDALLQLRGYSLDLEEIHLRGVALLSFVRRVCSGCAKRAQLDSSFLSEIPAQLQTLSFERYAVGRGCEACGQQGYRGLIGVQSIVAVDEPLVAAHRSGIGQVDLVSMLAPLGLKPLLEDGLLKATEGLTTLEAVGTACRTVPTVYSEYWKRGASANRSAGISSNTQAKDNGTPTSKSQSAHGAASPGSKPLFAARSAPHRREKPLVLVVEDDPDQRAILGMVLKSADYDVVQATNGVEGLEMVHRSVPDLIISDLMMPVMDGSEFVGRLKSEPQFSQVPILMLTMVADEEREYALLNLGADDYCEKTIQRKVLLKRVENLLKRSSIGAS